jgi:phosphoglycolate phosphatase
MDPYSIRTLIYDLDGTLIDSACDIQTSLNEVLKRTKRLPLDRALTERYIGGGLPQLLQQAFGMLTQAELDEIRAEFVQEYSKRCLESTLLYEGVREVLEHFSPKTQVILTNKPERFSIQVLEGLKADHFFSLILCGDSTPFIKPAKELVDIIQKEFPTKPEEMMIIGDSPVDIQTGKMSGIKTCAVTYGYRKRNELEAEKPDFLISNLRELKQIVH